MADKHVMERVLQHSCGKVESYTSGKRLDHKDRIISVTTRFGPEFFFLKKRTDFSTARLP